MEFQYDKRLTWKERGILHEICQQKFHQFTIPMLNEINGSKEGLMDALKNLEKYVYIKRVKNNAWKPRCRGPVIWEAVWGAIG